MKLKLALCLIGLSVSHLFASESVPQTDEERLEATIRLSLETAQAADAFRAKQAEALKLEKKKIGDVAFKALIFDAEKVASHSVNLESIQDMINRVRDTQVKHILTKDQADDLEVRLVSLVTQMSAITNAQKLGASKRSSR